MEREELVDVGGRSFGTWVGGGARFFLVLGVSLRWWMSSLCNKYSGFPLASFMVVGWAVVPDILLGGFLFVKLSWGSFST